jgi:hypothetical protein
VRRRVGESLRKGWTSLAALQITLEAAAKAGASTRLFAVGELDLPMFRPGMDAPPAARTADQPDAPASVARMAETERASPTPSGASATRCSHWTTTKSPRVAGPLSIAGQGAHCRLLMRHFGIERAHVVGHSSSANMRCRWPSTPRGRQSLALPEPALLALPTGPFGAQAIERYRTGDNAGAVDTWMRGVFGPAYRAVMEKVLPDAFDQAVADVDTFFAQEIPAVREWSFGRETAARVTRPALAVPGARTKEVTSVFDRRHSRSPQPSTGIGSRSGL